MKKLILSLCFLFATVAFADELDTTYVVSASGDTIGIIHKKGEVPVLPRKIQGDVVSVGNSASSEGEAGVLVDKKALAAQYADSVAYYRDRVNEILVKVKARQTYTWIGMGVGSALLLAGIWLNGKNFEGTSKSIVVFVNLLGVGTFVTGTVIGLRGNHLKERAVRYMKKRDSFMELLDMYSLDVVPVVDPVNKSLGGMLALSF